MTLESLVADATQSSVALGELRRRLDFPWLWPPRGARQDALLRLSGRRPPRMPIGQTLLVAVESQGARATLWRLLPRNARGDALLGADAAVALHRARGFVLKTLPLFAPPSRTLANWQVEFVGDTGETAGPVPPVVDGSSFGASFLLAAASQLLGRPVPVDAAASAELAADGTLRRVEAIALKLSGIAAWAPAVTRFFVASAQEAEARDALESMRCHGIEVHGVRDGHQLLEAAFGTLSPNLGRRRDIAGLCDAVFSLAVARPRLVPAVAGWPGVAKAAKALAARTSASTPAHAKAMVALRIARRHAGEPILLPESLPGEAWSRPLRLKYLAHWLQSVADSGKGDLARAIEDVRRKLPAAPHDAASDELVVFGALGRALARRRDYESALPMLLETARCWVEAGRGEEASHPACEALRVAGILAQRGAIRRAEVLAREIADEPLLAENETPFLWLAIGRAWVQGGVPGRGMSWLRRVTEETPETEYRHLSALRWWALGARALRRPAEAHGLRDRILARSGMGCDDIVLLTHLDVALERGTATDGLTRRFLRCPAGPEARHLLAACPRVDRARVLRWECPY